MAEDLWEKTRMLEQLEGIRLREIIAELKHREQLQQKCERRGALPFDVTKCIDVASGPQVYAQPSNDFLAPKHDTSKQCKQRRKLWGTLVLDK